MKLLIVPSGRRSWSCNVTDGAGTQVATTSAAKRAGLCGFLPEVDGLISMSNGAPAAVLRVEPHSRKNWVLMDAGGRRLATTRSTGEKVYVTFARSGVTVRWARAGAWHRHLEALRHQGKGGQKLSTQPLGTFKRTRGRCDCAAEFDDGALSVEAQLFLTWLGVQLLRDTPQSCEGVGVEEVGACG